MESEAKTLVLVSPATAASNNGNWHTAHRWASFLGGHCDTLLTTHWDPSPPGASSPHEAPFAMIALHARKSAPSIHAWARVYPERPLIVVLTGTDLYRDIHADTDAQRSLALATRLVVLQEDGIAALPAQWRHKAQVIYQSAPSLKPAVKSGRTFRAVMVGHLRDEKDPLTFMRAARSAASKLIRFDQIGGALEPGLAEAAVATAAYTPHYRWLGNQSRPLTRQWIRRAHVLVNSSRMEGGAQVILEAVQSGTAVLASRISGNVGMLGEGYAGYFEVGDDAGLAGLVRRCAEEPAYLRQLESQCRARAGLFDPAEEKRGVINLLSGAATTGAIDAAIDAATETTRASLPSSPKADR